MPSLIPITHLTHPPAHFPPSALSLFTKLRISYGGTRKILKANHTQCIEKGNSLTVSLVDSFISGYP